MADDTLYTFFTYFIVIAGATCAIRGFFKACARHAHTHDAIHYAREWKERYIPDLAQNMAIRQESPRAMLGSPLNPRRIPRTFNPQPDLLEHYLARFPREREDILITLEALTNALTKQLAGTPGAPQP